MIAFGEALPLIRERVDKDLALPGLPREIETEVVEMKKVLSVTASHS
jgi:hypothetical protein